MKRLVIPALLALLIAGCSSTPDSEPAAPVDSRNNDGKVATVTAGNMDSRKLPPELTDPKSILSKRSIYFDYDRFDIKPEYKDLVAAHARFLTNNRQFRILIQGNTDDRGSRVYNLALGQKRADSIKKMLVMMGAREDQVEAVSLGEEKPRAECANEAAWAENRRGDILYKGEY